MKMVYFDAMLSPIFLPSLWHRLRFTENGVLPAEKKGVIV